VQAAERAAVKGDSSAPALVCPDRFRSESGHDAPADLDWRGVGLQLVLLCLDIGECAAGGGRVGVVAACWRAGQLSHRLGKTGPYGETRAVRTGRAFRDRVADQQPSVWAASCGAVLAGRFRRLGAARSNAPRRCERDQDESYEVSHTSVTGGSPDWFPRYRAVATLRSASMAGSLPGQQSSVMMRPSGSETRASVQSLRPCGLT
jgi:hypothetical protein